MLLRALKTAGVRNLAPATLEPGPRFNVLAGQNGQGKTNLLEAIYVVCTLRSFRASRLREVIQLGADEAYIGARVERGGLERLYELSLTARSRKVKLDGKAVRPVARYFGHFNVVLFAPEDLLVPRGAPAERRRFLDRAVFARDPGHLALAQDYEKVLKSRNALLRDEHAAPSQREAMLDVYDEQLARLGAQVTLARRRYLAEMHPRFQAAFEAIAQAGLAADLVYEPAAAFQVKELAPILSLETSSAESDALAAELAAELSASRRRDLARGATSVGPHRDDLGFRLGGQPAASFASQGQLRAMVLAWKTAELELLDRAHGDPPVLLLDDVSSELDPQRNEYLFAFLRGQRSQCFITTTHPSYVLVGAERRDFTVAGGRVTPEPGGTPREPDVLP